MLFKVMAALFEESNSGWVWLDTKGFQTRDYVRISHYNKKEKKKYMAYCQVRIIDEAYVRLYNRRAPKKINISLKHKFIIMNGYYRKQLGGFKAGSKVDLEIKKIAKYNLFGLLRTFTGHPDKAIVTSSWLGIISFCLGFLSLIFAIMAL